ncbi:unnamed protein product [Trichobilharzia regenti]|nr:unnamed protein product [Trichobilharzia regenti]
MLRFEMSSLGHKFSDYAPKVDQLGTNVQFKNLYSQMSDHTPSSNDEQIRFKTTLADSCQQYKNNRHSVNSLLSKQHREALRELRSNESLIISKPDKGDGIVLLD